MATIVVRNMREAPVTLNFGAGTSTTIPGATGEGENLVPGVAQVDDKTLNAALNGTTDRPADPVIQHFFKKGRLSVTTDPEDLQRASAGGEDVETTFDHTGALADADEFAQASITAATAPQSASQPSQAPEPTAAAATGKTAGTSK